jgi:hypothetical protein
VFGGSTPAAIASRFNSVAQMWVADGPAERAERARRKLLSAIAASEPATLNQIAKKVGRGAPAVSRSVDGLVRRTRPRNPRTGHLSLQPAPMLRCNKRLFRLGARQNFSGKINEPA